MKKAYAILIIIGIFLVGTATGALIYYGISKKYNNNQEESNDIPYDQMIASLPALSPRWLNDHLDIYGLALPQRKSSFIRNMSAVNIYPTIIDAVVDKNNSEAACKYGHLRILQQITNNPTLVLEDDAVFNTIPTIALEQLKVSLDLLKHEPYVLYVGYCYPEVEQMINVHSNFLFEIPSGLWCCHAYIVGPKAAEVILKNTHLQSSLTIDKYLIHLTQQGLIRTYAITPPWFYQDKKNFGSTLHNPWNDTSQGLIAKA